MHSAVVFASLLAVASAAPQLIYSGLAAAPVGLTSSQYHAQDELGQYSYGYAGPLSAKSESKDAFGNVRGRYSYVDANGITQSANYVADDFGFRVAATNLPVGPAPAPAVVAAPVAAPIAAAPVAYAAPAFAHAAPVAYAAHGAPAVVSVAPGGGSVHVAPLPLPPADTPEVTAAKIQHFAAKAEAQARG